jgi:hypothetical protein
VSDVLVIDASPTTVVTKAGADYDFMIVDQPAITFMTAAKGQVDFVVTTVQGPPGVVVGDGDPQLGYPGLYVQTGLGDGTGFTFWIEDGHS